MIIAEQIATYLASKGHGTYSKSSNTSTIFVDQLPEKAPCIGVFSRQGFGSEYKIGYRNAGIQILYRGGTNPIDALEKAEAIFTELNGFKGTLVTNQNLVINIGSDAGGAYSIGPDKNRNYEYTMNFTVHYKL